MFNSNNNTAIKHHIRSLSGVSICNNPGSYLGIPFMVGKSKYRAFGALKDRVGTMYIIEKIIF